MNTLRFGRKLRLPSTIAIKHQVRMLMAQDEIKKAEAATRSEVVLLQSIPALRPCLKPNIEAANPTVQ